MKSINVKIEQQPINYRIEIGIDILSNTFNLIHNDSVKSYVIIYDTKIDISKINEVIESQELIKVKFLEHKDNKKSLSETICTKTDSEIVGDIGHTIMLFRQNPDKEKQKYRI